MKTGSLLPEEHTFEFDELQRKALLHELLVDISLTFINLPLDRIAGTLDDALEAIGTFVGASRVHILRLDPRTQKVSCDREWCQAGLEPRFRQYDFENMAERNQYLLNHLRGLPVAIPNTKLATNETCLDELIEQGIGSLLSVPMKLGALCIGFVGIEIVGSCREFSQEEQHLLEVFAQILVNLDERQRSEDQLRFSEKRFRLLLEDLPSVAVHGCNEEGSIIYWNKGAEIIYGFSQNEVLGYAVESFLIPKEEVQTFRRARKEMIDSGAAASPGEFELRNSHGESVPVFSTFAVIKSPRHQAELFRIDIDLRKIRRAEAEREALFEQLIIAQRLEAIGRLAGGVAHDFNNILSVISGHTEILLRERPSCPNSQIILDATKRSAALTRQLLTFARKQPTEPKEISPNPTIEALLPVFRRLAGEKIRIEWHPREISQKISIDPSQLDQLLLNLVVNSRDAITGEGKIVIASEPLRIDQNEMDRLPQVGPGDFIAISVSDDGCGMSEETQKRVFEPFFTTKAAGEGTGLGLATVYGIITQNGGTIVIDSALGRGTKIKVFLPVAGSQAPLLKECESISSTSSPTILLVDDEESQLRLCCNALRQHNYEVLCAKSGHDALALLNEHNLSVDILITDVVMPELGGRQLAKQLHERFPNLRSLFISGYPAHSLSLPNHLFLQKPFTMNELAMRVQKLLDTKDNQPTSS